MRCGSLEPSSPAPRPRPWWAGLSFLLLLLAASPLSSQEPSDPFEKLGALIEKGLSLTDLGIAQNDSLVTSSERQLESSKAARPYLLALESTVQQLSLGLTTAYEVQSQALQAREMAEQLSLQSERYSSGVSEQLRISEASIASAQVEAARLELANRVLTAACWALGVIAVLETGYITLHAFRILP